jgi:hypothetical protein
MSILRRVVDRKYSRLTVEAAQAILRLDYDATDRKRINQLAAKNRAGRLSADEDVELSNFIHIGQLLGILKSKARRAIRSQRPGARGK